MGTDTLTAWNNTQVLVTAMWGGRPSTVTNIADRLATTLKLLPMVDPMLAGSWIVAHRDGERIPTTAAGWVEVVERGVTHDDDDQPEPSSGYSVQLRSRGFPEAPRVDLRVHAGVERGSLGHVVNRVYVSFEGSTAFDGVDLRSLVPALQNLVKVLVAAWEPDAAYVVTPDAHGPQFKRPWNGWPVVGAITWLSDTVADIPSAVSGTTIERWNDGVFIAIPTFAAPSLSTAQMLAVRDDLVETGALRRLPAQQMR